MKYIIIPLIALGLVLSAFLCIEYNCSGPEVLPIYKGSPFIFQRTSLGASLEFYYSISGLLLNTLIWSMVIALLRLAVLRLIKISSRKRLIVGTYKVVVGILIAFSTLNIFFSLYTKGEGFDPNGNYWYWDVDQEAEKWGAKCEGEVSLFKLK